MGAVKTETKKETRSPFLARIRVDHDLPSLNQLKRLWRKGVPEGKIVREWRERFWGLQMEQLGPEWATKISVTRPHERRRLEVVRRAKRLLDRDNLWGGTKPLLDALKSHDVRVGGVTAGREPGWFYDDSDIYLDLHVMQLVTGESPWLEITLYGRTE